MSDFIENLDAAASGKNIENFKPGSTLLLSETDGEALSLVADYILREVLRNARTNGCFWINDVVRIVSTRSATFVSVMISVEQRREHETAAHSRSFDSNSVGEEEFKRELLIPILKKTWSGALFDKALSVKLLSGNLELALQIRSVDVVHSVFCEQDSQSRVALIVRQDFRRQGAERPFFTASQLVGK